VLLLFFFFAKKKNLFSSPVFLGHWTARQFLSCSGEAAQDHIPGADLLHSLFLMDLCFFFVLPSWFWLLSERKPLPLVLILFAMRFWSRVLLQFLFIWCLPARIFCGFGAAEHFCFVFFWRIASLSVALLGC
jgi:hypothetical protein